MNSSYINLTFPSSASGNSDPAFNRLAIIRALRVLSSGLGLKEAKDMTYARGPQLLQVRSSGVSTQEYFGAMHTLAENGVVIEPSKHPDIEPADTPESVHDPEALENIMVDIRLLLVDALRRKEYETAIQLVRILKDLDNS